MSMSIRGSSAPDAVPSERPDRERRPGDLRDRSLLAVFAHPDDESVSCGGLLAWCAELGVQVSLLCLTHGEHGPGAARPEDLRAIRARELQAAADCLGVTTRVLLDYEDGMLPWIDRAGLEADIHAAISRLRPDVVVTFGEDGLYWHPDHIAVHEATTAVVAAMADAPALFYVTMPAGSMPAVVAHAAAEHARRGLEGPPPARIFGISEAPAFGASAAPPTLIVHTGEFAARKLAAIRSHQSQLADCALTLVSTDDAPRLLGTEHYRRAQVGPQGAAFIEQFGS
jgi:LmbE family N-acetylglucosaminyl deacetylase